MRKWTACIAIMGVATIGFGLLRTVTRQETRVLAEGKAQSPFADDPFHPHASVPPAATRVRSHHTPPRSRPRILEDDHLVDLDESFALRNPNSPRPTPQYRLIDDEPASVSPAPAVVPRVTLALTADHQIQVVPSAQANLAAIGLPNTGVILITAEKFQLTPPTEPGVGNQIHCSGAVEILSPQFTASGTKLSIHKGELVLEGTSEHPAVVTKTAAPAAAAATATLSRPTPVPDRSFGELAPDQDQFLPPTPAAPRAPPVPTPPRRKPGLDEPPPSAPTPAPIPKIEDPFAALRVPSPAPQTQVVPPPALEFRVSANRITFTLNLDRLQVGNATVITPAATDAPAKPADVKPVETNGTSDAKPLPPPVPEELLGQDALSIGQVLKLPGQN